MSTNTSMHPLAQKEINQLATLDGLYGLAAFLILNIGILFWVGGLGSGLYGQLAGRSVNFEGSSESTLQSESNMGSLLKTSMSNPGEHSLVNQLENQEVDQEQTITFNPLAPATYGDTDITLLATASSGLPVTFESDNPGVAMVSGNSLTIIGTGTANIVASQLGNENYDPAPDVVQVLIVNKATLSATADNKTKFYGDPNPVFTITYTGFKGSDNAMVLDTPPALATDATQFSPVDSYSISFISEGTDNNYNITPLTDGTLTISKADLAATADNKTKIYGDLNPALTITYSGFKGSDDASVLDSPPTIATEVTQFSPADSYSISFISEGTDNNYTIAPLTDGTLTISKANLSATADNKTKTYGDPNPAFTITYSGFKGSDNAAAFDTPPLLTTNATQFSPVDLYTISFVNEGTDNDYEISSFTDGTLTINKADQEIDFEEIVGKTIFDPSFALVATSTSGLPVSFTSSNTAVISISGTTATIHGSGTTIITASQTGDTNFNTADDVTQEVMVSSKMTQSITFEAILNKTLGDPSFTISATSSSDLNVTFDAQTSNITVAGNRVTLVNAGRATIRATQPGNNDYDAAEPVSQSFCVNPAKPIITLSNANTEAPTLTSSATSGNQWFLNGNPISGATSATFNATVLGSYTVRSTVEGCDSEISNEQVIIITGDLTGHTNPNGMLYPVPARNQIFISLVIFSYGEDVQLNILDINGRQLHQQVAPGGTVAEIDIAQFNNGLYLLKAQQGQNFSLFKFIKE